MVSIIKCLLLTRCPKVYSGLQQNWWIWTCSGGKEVHKICCRPEYHKRSHQQARQSPHKYSILNLSTAPTCISNNHVHNMIYRISCYSSNIIHSVYPHPRPGSCPRKEFEQQGLGYFFYEHSDFYRV